MRGFALGKSRLAASLDDRERDRLNRALFARTAGCAAEIFGADRVLVVSPDEIVLAAAARLGLRALREPSGAGLNGALAFARNAAIGHGATALLSLSCDLPLLRASDVGAALDAWTGTDGIVIAPDEAGTGTNALLLPVAADFCYAMGPGSAACHREAAREARLGIAEISRPGLAFDLDTPADLARWRAQTEVAA
jgi:2-phospho-L-lactate guanylyltransferase